MPLDKRELDYDHVPLPEKKEYPKPILPEAYITVSFTRPEPKSYFESLAYDIATTRSYSPQGVKEVLEIAGPILSNQFYNAWLFAVKSTNKLTAAELNEVRIRAEQNLLSMRQGEALPFV